MESRLKFGGCEDHRLEALSKLESYLPPDTPAQKLRVLSLTRALHRGGPDLARDLADTAKIVCPESPTSTLLGLLRSDNALPAADQIGSALAILGLDIYDGAEMLVEFLDTANEQAIFGFLVAHLNEGHADSFDKFIDRNRLAPSDVLRISVGGVRTAAAATRIHGVVKLLPVAESAKVTAYWMHGEDEAVTARLLQQWKARIASQEDYNAVLDFAAVQVHEKDERLPKLDGAIATLLHMRRDYPYVGESGYSWRDLFRRQMTSAPLESLALLADCIEADQALGVRISEDTRLLRELIPLAEEAGWVYVMDRIGQGERRLRRAVDDWLGNSATVEVAKRWMGTDAERARTLAGVCRAEGEVLPPVVVFLIDDFGEDREIQSQLRASFGCGVWVGDESGHLKSQIAMAEGWASARGQSKAVKSWSRSLVKRLESDRVRALREEQEEDF